jgi:antitoxin VapB
MSERAASPAEIAVKRAAVRTLLEEKNLDALLLRRVSSFSWATCGRRSEISTAVEAGEAALVLTAERRFVLTNNIEAPRLLDEERLAEQGFEPVIHPWHEPEPPLSQLLRVRRVGVDRPAPGLLGAVDVSGELSRLRSMLAPEEGERFRSLGRLCAEAMDAAARALAPGQTEHEIAAVLARECVARGVCPVVDLVATDQRVFELRHPVPTDKKLERSAMLVLCGRRAGLVCSITRLVHFGKLPADLEERSKACAQVDARLIAATRPGAVLSDILYAGISAYRELGFAGEWELHHQGGVAGYEPRELVATPSVTATVRTGQVYAWNPSIAGTKSEDSVLITAGAPEILTAIPGWPTVEIEVSGERYVRPAILIR